MTKNLTTLAFEAGATPFDLLPRLTVNTKALGDVAATLLFGRNPYFDAAYRARFGTSVHLLELYHARLVLGAVESAKPAGERKRAFRAVLFRCDGEVLYQTHPSMIMTTQEAAAADLHYRASRFTAEDVLIGLLHDLIKKHERIIFKAGRALKQLEPMPPPATPA